MLKISIHAITVAYNFNMLVIGEYIVGGGHYLHIFAAHNSNNIHLVFLSDIRLPDTLSNKLRNNRNFKYSIFIRKLYIFKYVASTAFLGKSVSYIPVRLYNFVFYFF